QFTQACLVSNRPEMAHQDLADALPLILVENCEGYLCLARRHDDISRAAHDHWSASLAECRDQGDVIDEVDVHKEGNFVVAKLTLNRKEPVFKGMRADTVRGRNKVVAIFRPERANCELASVSQCLNR